MTSPPVPSPAATLVLLRDGAGGLETLLIQRHAGSRFAGGDHVFPGGKIEADDLPEDGERFCRGLTAQAAAAWLGADLSPRRALSYWVGAIREAFEEVGVLLAYGSGGSLLEAGALPAERLAEYRRACHADNRAFFAMLRTEGLILATDRLVYFAHWITPEESPLRFDTRFFAAPMPAGQSPEPDGHEIVGCRWLAPAEALAAMRRKEITLRLPTMKNLELLAACGTTAEALRCLAGREVRPIRPRLLTVDGKPLAVLPGDPRWY